MRLAIFTVAAALVALTGCSSTTRGASTAADLSSDPAWTPPGEVHMTIADNEPAPIRRSSKHGEHMGTPNRRAIVKNALHAATY